MMTLTEAVRAYVLDSVKVRRNDVAMAKASGLTQSWINRFLNGERGTLSVDRAAALAKVYDMTVGEFLDAVTEFRAVSERASHSRHNRRAQEAEGQLEIPARQGDDHDGELSPSVLEALAKQRTSDLLRLHGVVTPAVAKPRRRRPS